MRLIDKVLTAAEAAELWGLAPDTVKQACIDSKNGIKKNPFHLGEYRKSKATWLVTKSGMERLYGPMPENSHS